MKKIICLILITSFLIVGCTKESNAYENYVKVEPSKLFEGDAIKLAPHFDMITGSAKVKYIGNKKSICLKYEIWENGRIKESHNASSKFVDNNKFDGEVSISLKEITGTDLERSNFMIMKTVISEDNGYIGSTKYIDRFDEDCSYGPIEIYEELNVTDDEEIIVWGLTAQKGSYISTGGSIEDEVKASDWGLILKVFFE
ncbi:hypothetical protein [Brassicibacter mesophilus]|uniref:hypothetical protein n=1 Tax=Brassicibacter mesophilus TaxID=745119 RepID=UPI003D225196